MYGQLRLVHARHMGGVACEWHCRRDAWRRLYEDIHSLIRHTEIIGGWWPRVALWSVVEHSSVDKLKPVAWRWRVVEES